MSDLNNTREVFGNFRHRLLATASAIVLTGLLSQPGPAQAADDDSPIVWIELGGQLNFLNDGQEKFSPPFLADRPSIFEPSQLHETPPRYSIDETAALSFQPDGTDWIFSASVRYGRSRSKRDFHQQTNPGKVVFYYYGTSFGRTHVVKSVVQTKQAAKFADTANDIGEQHTIIDFMAGRDVGLGMFAGASSVLSGGIRFAQFASRTNIALKSDPDAHPHYIYLGKTPHGGTGKLIAGGTYHSNAAALSAERSFHGIGPSLSWKASAPIAEGTKDDQLTIDWGANAAVLFGRQRTRAHHQTTTRYHQGKYMGTHFRPPVTLYQTAPAPASRNRMIAVPNIGGFAGLSFQYANAKISFGYRADLFFGAMDGGIDTRKSENVGFYGPFASVSVGFGG